MSDPGSVQEVFCSLPARTDAGECLVNQLLQPLAGRFALRRFVAIQAPSDVRCCRHISLLSDEPKNLYSHCQAGGSLAGKLSARVLSISLSLRCSGLHSSITRSSGSRRCLYSWVSIALPISATTLCAENWLPRSR